MNTNKWDKYLQPKSKKAYPAHTREINGYEGVKNSEFPEQLKSIPDEILKEIRIEIYRKEKFFGNEESIFEYVCGKWETLHNQKLDRNLVWCKLVLLDTRGF